MKSIFLFLVVVGGLLFWSHWLNSTPEDASIISHKGLHWHSELAIYINGEKQEIPEGIGLVGGHSPIHTHDDVPTIHLEFEGVVRAEDTELGKFFEAWGKPFNASRIFEYQNGPEGSVHLFVNGKENTEFEHYQMQDGDKIEIRYE